MALRTEAVPPATVAGGRPPAWARWCWLLPPLVLALLGGWLIAQHHGFWYDELYTAEVAALPLSRLLRAVVSGDGTIPYLRDAPPSYNAPYYALAHLWLVITGLGPDETGLRLLSLVSAAAAAAVFTRAVDRLAGVRIGLVAGLVVATNPFVVRYSAEARGYALALLATALALLGLARWLDGARGGLWLYGPAAAACGLVHWFALLVPVALAVATLILRRRQALPVLAVTAAACVPAMGLVAIAVANGVGASGAEWIGGVGGAVGWLLLKAWTRGHQGLLALTAAAVAGALVVRRGEHRQALVIAVTWVAVPVALVTALELVRPVFVARYLLPSAVGVAVLVALGAAKLPGRLGRIAVVAILATSLSATVGAVTAGPTEDGRGAVEALAARHQPGEPVVAAARWDALTLDHYVTHDHPALVPDLVLPDRPVPPASAVWVVRRASAGVKGDPRRLAALDRDLAARGYGVVDERRFEGRSSDVIVQRWQARPVRG